jgi:hypothetical protein
MRAEDASEDLAAAPPSSFNQAADDDQQDGRDERHGEGDHKRLVFADQTVSELLEQNSSEQASDNTEDEIPRRPQSSAMRKRACQPAHHQTDTEQQK